MAKKQLKQNPIQLLDERLQQLMKKRLQAYNAGAGAHILDQIERMIEETQLDLYTESELQRHRDSGKEDGEEWIV